MLSRAQVLLIFTLCISTVLFQQQPFNKLVDVTLTPRTTLHLSFIGYCKGLSPEGAESRGGGGREQSLSTNSRSPWS